MSHRGKEEPQLAKAEVVVEAPGRQEGLHPITDVPSALLSLAAAVARWLWLREPR